MSLHPCALDAHIAHLGQADTLLQDAWREGERQSHGWLPCPSRFEAREHARRQHWADRIERFLRSLCGALAELRRATQNTQDAEAREALRLMQHEVEALFVQPLDAHGTTLTQLLKRERTGVWGPDILELEFCVRRRPAQLLLILEAFANEQLGFLVLLIRHYDLASVRAILQAASTSALACTG